MRGRVTGAAVAAAVIGLGGGAAAAYVAQPSITSGGVATPVPAVSPSVPFLPTTPALIVNPDPPGAPLEAPTTFDRLRFSSSLATWSFVKPKGWQAWCIGPGNIQSEIADADVQSCADSGVYFRPSGEAIVGGYSLRVKTLSDHQTPAYEVQSKQTGLEGGPLYAEVTMLPKSNDSELLAKLLNRQLGTDGYLLRYNFFRWFNTPGSTEATLEMSVSGRTADEPGLRALFDTFATKLKPVR